jgi:transcriptional regulator GlxA family with amidase domain
VHERVARARDLLETTDDSIEHIAGQCGFGSAQSLRVHFALINQTSPYRYMRCAKGVRLAAPRPISLGHGRPS